MYLIKYIYRKFGILALLKLSIGELGVVFFCYYFCEGWYEWNWSVANLYQFVAPSWISGKFWGFSESLEIFLV